MNSLNSFCISFSSLHSRSVSGTTEEEKTFWGSISTPKTRKGDTERKLAGSIMKFLNKPENKECQEILDSATASTSTDPEPMEVSEEKKICCSPSSDGDSRDTRTYKRYVVISGL